jgi:hypothetical protein
MMGRAPAAGFFIENRRGVTIVALRSIVSPHERLDPAPLVPRVDLDAGRVGRHRLDRASCLDAE